MNSKNNRSSRSQIARETLEICKLGAYNISGQTVSIADSIQSAKQSTQIWEPSDLARLPSPAQTYQSNLVELRPETSLEACQRLVSENPSDKIMCLNFASARNPGGGFLSGAQAQEESLARASALYPCLQRCDNFYNRHRKMKSGIYSDAMIYSAGVPVFRNDDGQLLENPYNINFITAPAVNAGVLRRQKRQNMVYETMLQRTDYVLRLAAHEGCTTLVLGAWGCGVFRNDPTIIARVFFEFVGSSGRYLRAFKHIVFAIPNSDGANYKAFETALNNA